MTTPLIALTTYGRHEITLKTRHYSEWFAIPTLYVDAVRRSGGVPLLLPPGEPNWETVLEVVDAVILIGGGDLDPRRYAGNEAHPALHNIDPERDGSELALAHKLAHEKRLPTLCICRGMQVVNVALGGSLYEHIPDIVPEDMHRDADAGWTVHTLKIRDGSLLAEILGTTVVETFSGHHQALRELARALQITASAADGIVEAVEKTDHPWFVAVQWHPEMSARDDQSQQRIFDALVEAASNKSS
jgi:putative glutamine amidotransferase